jgi:hypothetical protein
MTSQRVSCADFGAIQGLAALHRGAFVILNTFKTVFLLTLLTGLLVVAGRLLGGEGGMAFAVVIAVVMNSPPTGSATESLWHSHARARSARPRRRSSIASSAISRAKRTCRCRESS